MKYCKKHTFHRRAPAFPVIFAVIAGLFAGLVFFDAYTLIHRRDPAEMDVEKSEPLVARVAPVLAGTSARGVSSLPAMIEENRGQFGREVQYATRGAGYVVEFDKKGLEVAVRGRRGEEERAGIGIEFVRAGEIKWRGAGELKGRANYLIGRDSRGWKQDVPLFASVGARGIFAGVDCRTRTEEVDGRSRPEFDLTVAPHGDVRRIRMRLSGAERVDLNAAGDLEVHSRGGIVELARPVAFQGATGEERSAVETRYVLVARNVVGLRVGKYDRDQALVIDPSISVTYATFLGGAGSDAALSVAAGANGKIYVAGNTSLANFPGLTTSAQGPGGQNDFFVAEIDPTQSGATSLVYLTFIGGSGNEAGGKLAVNPTGEVALVGTTTSSDYPVTDSSKRTSGPNDLAVTVLSGTGSTLSFSTLLGGSGLEGANGKPSVAFDPSGNVVVAADTTSTNLPVTAGAYQSAYGGGESDGMLAVYSPAGTVTYLTYFGINAADEVAVTGVAEDILGQAYVTGFTSQPLNGSFSTKNGFQTAYGGGNFDGFVMSLTPKGLGASDLNFSSYFGGDGADEPLGIAVDDAVPAGIYIAGLTESGNFLNGANLPDFQNATAGFQTTLNGPINGFVAAVTQSATGATTLGYWSYMGGTVNDSLQGIAALAPDAVFVTGLSESPTGFGYTGLLQTFTGSADAVLAKVDTTQTGSASLTYFTYLGGRNNAQGNGVAATSAGNVFVAGSTSSPDFPIAGNPQNGAQVFCASCSATPAVADAFVVALTENAAPSPIVEFNASQLNFGSQMVGSPNPPLKAEIENAGTLPLNISGMSIVGVNGSDFSVSASECPPPVTLQPGGTCGGTINFSPTLATNESAGLSVTDNAPGSPQTLTLVGKGLEPVGTIAPASISFGSQPTGAASAQQMITVTNTGDLVLNISLLTLTGANATSFAIEAPNNCTNPPMVQAGASCTVSVAFEPQSVGTFTAALQFVDNQGNVAGAMQSVALSGNGIPPSPVANLTPAAVNFGFHIFGTSSGPQTVTLGNTGTLAMQLSGVTIGGANAGDFTVGPGTTCAVNGGSLNASTACVVNVAFAPTAQGPRTATLSVVDNAPGSPQMVALSGAGTSASLTVNSTALAFAPQTLNVASTAQTVTVQNSGSNAISISSIAVSGANPADFVEASNCPVIFNPGLPCKVSTAFQPTAGGPRTAVVQIASNAPNSPQVVALSGTGLVPAVQLGSVSATFGSEIVGGTSAPVKVNLSNPGNGALAIVKPAMNGPAASDFTFTDTCGAMLKASGSCDFQIIFKPTQPGARSAALQINDNAPDSPQFISVSGTGTDFAIAAAGPGGQSVSVSAGSTATYSLQAVPEGGFAGQVTLGCVGAPTDATCTVSPATVNLDGKDVTPFTVTVTTEESSGVEWGRPRGVHWIGGGLSRVAGLSGCVILVIGLLWRHVRGGRARRWARVMGFSLAGTMVLVLVMQVGCGGGGAGGSSGTTPPSEVTPATTPAGTYTLEVTGSSGGVSKEIPLTLVVQ